MNEKPKSKRGGRRPGAGRKRDPLKDLRTGALTAQKILKEINDEREIPKLYRQLTPPQKLMAIFRLRESAYGRPGIVDETPKSKEPMQVNVHIHRIGA